MKNPFNCLKQALEWLQVFKPEIKKSYFRIKVRHILFTLSLFMSMTLSAQEKIEVQDVTKQTSRGEQPGFTLNIKGATLEKVNKKWTQTMKNQKLADLFKSSDEKTKVELKEGEYLTQRAKLTEISEKPMNTIATITGTEGGVMVTGFFELDSVFISSKSTDNLYLAARNYMHNFGVACYKDIAQEELDRENDKLKDLENHLDDLKSKKNKLEKSIAKNETEISELESEIRTNLVDQDRANIKVTALKDTLSQFAKKTPNYEVYSAKLKEASKDLKKLVSENSSCHKKIENNKIDIQKAQDDIKTNLIEQDYQVKQIETQKGIVNAVKTKLENIK
jgi:hypothetical protein